MKKMNKSGQSIIEYTIIITIVIAAFIMMGSYIKRGLQGRFKASIDNMGEQYDPYEGDIDIIHQTQGNTTTVIMRMDDPGGWWTKRVDNSITVEGKAGYMSTAGY